MTFVASMAETPGKHEGYHISGTECVLHNSRVKPHEGCSSSRVLQPVWPWLSAGVGPSALMVLLLSMNLALTVWSVDSWCGSGLGLSHGAVKNEGMKTRLMARCAMLHAPRPLPLFYAVLGPSLEKSPTLWKDPLSSRAVLLGKLLLWPGDCVRRWWQRETSPPRKAFPLPCCSENCTKEMR